MVTYLELTFNEVTTYSISATVANGSDTLLLGISIPALTTGSYTKATSDSDVSISISVGTDINGSSYGTTEPFSNEEENLTDYTLEITEVTDNTVSGTFSATLYNFLEGSSAEASGDFVATDLSFLFF